MQASSIVIMPATVNYVDPASDASSSGQGIRMNSGLQTKSQNSLFTAILQQGITLNTAAGGTAVPAEGGEGTGKKEAENTTDVCSLLMQIMAMNTSPTMQMPGDAQASPGADSTAISGINDIIAELTGGDAGGLLAQGAESPAVLFQDDGAKTADLFNALAAAGIQIGGAGNGLSASAGQIHNGSVISEIAQALNNNLPQKAVEAVNQADAASVTAAAVLNANGEKTGNFNAAALAGINQPWIRTGDDTKSTGISQEPAAISDSAVEADLPIGIKATGTMENSGENAEGGLNLGAHDSGKDRENEVIGTSPDQVLVGSTFKNGTAAEKTAAVEKALNRFTEDLRSFNGSAQEIKIILEPESLGTLTIAVTKTETGVSAKIKAEDKDLVAAISDHIQKLISTMESKGIRLDNVDVVYSQTEQNTGFGQQQFDRGGDHTPKGHTYAPAKKQDADAAGNEFWQGYYGNTKGSDASVEYRI